tara:strand:+ start:228 stop:416 length:189 start_codon:yes stop_codon:yes gene_type:complete
MFKAIFLVGYFCYNSQCISVNEKHTSLEDCQKQGIELHFLLKEYDIRKYRFACVDATEYDSL